MTSVYIGDNQYVNVKMSGSLPTELSVMINKLFNQQKSSDPDRDLLDVIVNYYMELVDRYNNYIHSLNKYAVEEQLTQLHYSFFKYGNGQSYLNEYRNSIYQQYLVVVNNHNKRFEPTSKPKHKYKMPEVDVELDYNIRSIIPSTRIIKTTKKPKIKPIPKTSRFIQTKDKLYSGSDIESEDEIKTIIKSKPIKTKQELLDAKIKPKPKVITAPEYAIKDNTEYSEKEIKRMIHQLKRVIDIKVKYDVDRKSVV